ncbi:MAG TPA: DUF2202 domain-containing protein [Burkholderiaceae bacterium]|nr:DUF2202 domain-containing protein [Burkholderiaceae bacterium]
MTTRTLTHIAAAVFIAISLTACGGGGDTGTPANGNGGPPLVVDADGNSTFNASVLGTTLSALPTETLSAAEQSSLVYMREEEKLAGDVYARLGATWGLKIFTNISTSESTHTEAVLQLLLRYNVTDPAANLGVGLYTNATLQGLYTQLVAAGSVSLIEALKVGAAIEELDMLDINTHLKTVDNQDIKVVYDNLLKGSRNHLRSFYKTLLQQGGTYNAQYLAQAEFDAIVNSAIEK